MVLEERRGGVWQLVLKEGAPVLFGGCYSLWGADAIGCYPWMRSEVQPDLCFSLPCGRWESRGGAGGLTSPYAAAFICTMPAVQGRPP